MRACLYYVLMLSAMIVTIFAMGEEREVAISIDKVKGPKYKVDVSKNKSKLFNRCQQSIVVSGKGIGEKYIVPCSVYGLNIITTDRVLVVRNRDKNNPLVVYSDTPSVLIDVFGDKCTKITYKTVNDKATYTEYRLDKKDCGDVLQKVQLEEKKATNPYKEARRKAKLVLQRISLKFVESHKSRKPVVFQISSPVQYSGGDITE